MKKRILYVSVILLSICLLAIAKNNNKNGKGKPCNQREQQATAAVQSSDEDALVESGLMNHFLLGEI
jgi:hypothetical protein